MSDIALKKEGQQKATVVKKIRDYGNEPAFKRKAEKAAAFLKKNGLPESFAKKK